MGVRIGLTTPDTAACGAGGRTDSDGLAYLQPVTEPITDADSERDTRADLAPHLPVDRHRRGSGR